MSGWRALGPRVGAFAAFGLLDGLIAAWRTDLPLGPALLAVLAAVGLWALVGGLLAPLQSLAWWLLAGPGGDLRVGLAVRGALGRWWRERGTAADLDRLATTAGALVGAVVLLVGSFAFLKNLIENRHGAALIALTFLGGQVALLGVALAAAAIKRRAVRSALGALRARWPWTAGLSLPAVAGGLGVLGAAALSVVLVRQWEVVIATDAVALALPVLALAVQPALARWRDRPLGSPWVGVGAPLAALVVIAAVCTAPGARRVLREETTLAKYVYRSLQQLSDVDGDGAPAYPSLRDCAPFDRTRHPLADEVPGNGVDEDCDGVDGLPPGYEPRRLPFVAPAGFEPNLVLLTVDALRADHVGFLGQQRPLTPNLDALAARAVVFEQAWSQDSGTGPSFWALMAGKTPFQAHLTNTNRFPADLAPDESVLAEGLSDAGYETSAVLCGDMFTAHRWNIRRGFGHFEEVCGTKKKTQVAEGTAKKALAELNRLKATGEPFFLWVHFLDPHHPHFDHKDRDLGRRPIDFYAEEVAYTDHAMKPLLAALDKLRDTTVVVVTADHGENFDEHGPDPHARTLYREVTHVPLLFVGPGLTPRRVRETVAQGDVHPTLLDLAGAPFTYGKDTTMVSQAPVLYGAPADPDRLVFQENSWSRPKRHAKAAVGRGVHLILDVTNDTLELYDTAADPAEKHDLSGHGLPIEAEVLRELKSFVRTTRVPAGYR